MPTQPVELGQHNRMAPNKHDPPPRPTPIYLTLSQHILTRGRLSLLVRHTGGTDSFKDSFHLRLLLRESLNHFATRRVQYLTATRGWP